MWIFYVCVWCLYQLIIILCNIRTYTKHSPHFLQECGILLKLLHLHARIGTQKCTNKEIFRLNKDDYIITNNTTCVLISGRDSGHLVTAMLFRQLSNEIDIMATQLHMALKKSNTRLAQTLQTIFINQDAKYYVYETQFY